MTKPKLDRVLLEELARGRAAEALAEDAALVLRPLLAEEIDGGAELVLAVPGQRRLLGGLAEAALAGPAEERPALGAVAAERGLDLAGEAALLHLAEELAERARGLLARRHCTFSQSVGGGALPGAEIDEVRGRPVGRELAGRRAIHDREEIVTGDERGAEIAIGHVLAGDCAAVRARRSPRAAERIGRRGDPGVGARESWRPGVEDSGARRRARVRGRGRGRGRGWGRARGRGVGAATRGRSHQRRDGDEAQREGECGSG